MSSSIMSIGESALFAAQTALATTSHNIANASVTGYNRQIVDQASAGAQDTGSGFIGQGTVVNNVSRVYDQMLSTQVLSSQASSSSYTAYSSSISQIDNVIGDTNAGLSTALQTFFAGLQDLTANPSTDSSRQSALSSAQTLAARFQSLASQFTDSNNAVNSTVTSSVTSLNAYATELATLNDSIVQAQAATGDTPNDLLDQRDSVLANMNKIVKVSTMMESNGAMDVSIGNGQPLVQGDQVSTLVATPSADDPSQMGIGVVSNGNTIRLPDSSFTGGSLGGTLAFRSQTLNPAKNELGQIATVMASDFNAQNALGLDQNGNPGGNFFNIDPPTVISKTGNSPTASLTATVTDASQLTTSDYQMKFDGTNYTITRLSDGNQTVIAGPPTTYPNPAPEVDGVTFNAPTMAAGDSFTIKPTANAAASLSVALSDPSAIATAAPIATSSASTNTGNGTISAGSVDKNFLTTPAPTLPLTATFGTPPTSFTLTQGAPPGTAVTPANVLVNGVAASANPIPYTAGATITYQGMSFVLNGTPAATDSFTVAANTGASGDNRNIQLMAAMQTTPTINGSSFQDAYSSIVSQVGNQANQMNVLGAAETSRLTSLTTAQQSESGVNTDQELANMVQQQSAYQAAAKIIQAVSDMFTVIFALT
ncbi:MAG: flagellar hook-associated protein FlgK [Herbaspirillum sp.]|jgi:flagellar hook-associated protein 1 FlgK|nr:flagellar hook-associated protein FlgK [Herbaspirillum sp.]